MSATILPMGYTKYQELIKRVDNPEQIEHSQCFEIVGDVLYFYNWRTATWWCWRAADNRCHEI